MASRETSVSGFCNSVFLFRQLTHVQDNGVQDNHVQDNHVQDNGDHRELQESQSGD